MHEYSKLDYEEQYLNDDNYEVGDIAILKIIDEEYRSVVGIRIEDELDLGLFNIL